MLTTGSTQSTILVGVDGSSESDAAVAWAACEAAMRHAPVTLTHVIPPVMVGVAVAPTLDVLDWYENSARHVLECAERDLRSSWGGSLSPDVRLVIDNGGIVAALVDASKDAQMVVVASGGSGRFGDLMLGSASRGLLHHAHCPVVVIRTDRAIAADPRAPVLLGVDCSSGSQSATALAFDEASRREVDLVALHVWSDVGIYLTMDTDWHVCETQAYELLAHHLAGWQERYPNVRVHRRIACDKPAYRLSEESRRAAGVRESASSRSPSTMPAIRPAPSPG